MGSPLVRQRKLRRRLFRSLALLGLLFALLGSAASLPAPEVLVFPAQAPAPLIDVIVQGPSGGYLSALVQAHGGKVTRDLSVIGSIAARVPADCIVDLEREPGVTRVWQDTAVRSG